MSDVPNQGVCVPKMGTGTQGQMCTVTLTPDMMRIATDTCETSGNLQCFGVTQSNLNGQCAHLCKLPPATDLCPSLGGAFVCSNVFNDPTIGACLSPPETFTDVGSPCPAAPGMCMGGAQSCITLQMMPTVINACSSPCDGIKQCPATGVSAGICVVPMGGTPICLSKCTPTVASGQKAMNTACMSRNPGTPNCQNIGATGTMTDGVCIN
jgi:hypothetical protein